MRAGPAHKGLEAGLCPVGPYSCGVGGTRQTTAPRRRCGCLISLAGPGSVRRWACAERTALLAWGRWRHCVPGWDRKEDAGTHVAQPTAPCAFSRDVRMRSGGSEGITSGWAEGGLCCLCCSRQRHRGSAKSRALGGRSRAWTCRLRFLQAHRHGFFLAGSGSFLVFLPSLQLPLPGRSGSVLVGLHCPLPAPRLAQRAPQVRLPGGPAWLGPSSAVSQDGGQKNKIKKSSCLLFCKEYSYGSFSEAVMSQSQRGSGMCLGSNYTVRLSGQRLLYVGA